MTEMGQFIWDGYSWETQLDFPDWQDYTLPKTMDYPSTYASEGLMLSLDNGDVDTPPSERQHEQLQWIQAHQVKIQNAMLNALFKQYPDFKEEALEWYDEEDEPMLPVMLPDVQTIEDLKRPVFPRSFMLIGKSEILGKPLFAIDVDCSWDDHGLGILMYGEKVLEVAEAECIFDTSDLEKRFQKLKISHERKKAKKNE